MPEAAADPRWMGIVNVTPDSFSDGGQHTTVVAAVDHALRLIDEGADVVDVGGESTRPGAAPVDPSEELRRVEPVIRGILARRPSARVSVDTRRVSVARGAIDAGAVLVNDVSGAADPQMLPLVAGAGVGIVLMHMRGTPATMQQHTQYDDVVGEVTASLAAGASAAVAAGVREVWLDPGVGFAKAGADNARLIAGLPRLTALGFPVLVGASRKRFIGDLTGVTEPSARVAGSIGAALAAALRGAAMVRVHDVAATIQAWRVLRACLDG